MSQIPDIGSRAQVGALTRAMADALGNKDGILDNEDLSRGSLDRSSFFDRQPLLSKLKTAGSTGLSARDEVERLSRFVSAQEERWGEPTTTLTASAIPDFERFRTEKAIALTRFGRKPSDVVDGLVPARGSVDGQAIVPRDVFVQNWKPLGEPSGTVVVVSPGFLQTGRHFYEQVDLLNRQGHEVLVMDQQWAGYSSGSKGGIDRGFGIARDVAAVAARAQELAESSYPDRPHRVVLLGTSMGAGAGVLGAVTMNDAGKIRLEGPQMPRGLSAVLQAPYFDKTPSLVNKGLSVLGRVPILKDMPLPSLGLPILAEDRDINQKLADHANAEGIVARAQAFHASDADIRRMRELLDSGQKPEGRFYFVHGKDDPLASLEASREFAGLLGDRAQFLQPDSGNHVMEEGKERDLMLRGLDWVTRNE